MKESLLLTESNTSKTRAAYVALLALGLLFFYLAPNSTSRFEIFHRSFNTISIFATLLCGGGFLGILWTENVNVFLSEHHILVRKKNFFRTKEDIFFLTAIEKVHVASIGRSRGPHSFHLLIYLKSGSNIKTGRWSWDQSTMLDEADRLSQQLQTTVTSGILIYPLQRKISVAGVSMPQTALAIVAAVVSYALWYRWQVGPWCPAMWGGTAPCFFIISGTWFYLSILRRIPQKE